MVVSHPYTQEHYSQYNNNTIIWLYIIPIHENTIVNTTTTLCYGCLYLIPIQENTIVNTTTTLCYGCLYLIPTHENTLVKTK